MDFNNIDIHIISIHDFPLNWRFTDEKYNLLPDDHLGELKPLDREASNYLDDFIIKSTLLDQHPFKNAFFRTSDNARIIGGDEKEIKKWLFQRALPFDKTVYLSWDSETSMKTKWKYVVKYWDSFFYEATDDLIVFDDSLEWALYFYHEGEIYWGTNKNFGK
nr:DUF2947 family protein [Bacteroidota bacterium]